MSYPIYSNDQVDQLTCNIGENIAAHEFRRFMERLSYDELLSDAEEIEALEKAIAAGTIRLTEQDHEALRSVVDRYDKPCKRTGCNEELAYRIYLDAHGGYCDLCHYRQQKQLDY